MLQAASQMDTLIQDLLDVTRLELGRMRLTPQMIRAVDLVEVAVDTLAPLAAARRLRLEATVSSQVEAVQADPDRILQVLSNLIGNAVKFTPAGGRVDVHVTSDGDAVRFTVQDTGAGLGLAIARGLIQAHGGRIWVESTLNEGTAVHFTLPLGAAPVPVLTTGTAALA